jgi:hypothetical protein
MLNKQVTPIISEAKVGTLEEFGEFMHHPGEEFVYVVAGALELHTDSYAPVLLQTGESIYFESSMGHAYVAHGDTPCRFLCVCTVAHHETGAEDSREPTPPSPAAKAKSTAGTLPAAKTEPSAVSTSDGRRKRRRAASARR